MAAKHQYNNNAQKTGKANLVYNMLMANNDHCTLGDKAIRNVFSR
jgi:hypothetical protein